MISTLNTYLIKNSSLSMIFLDDFKIFRMTLTRLTKKISTILLMNNWIVFVFALYVLTKLKRNCRWKKIISKNFKKLHDTWLSWFDSVKWIERFFENWKIERYSSWFAINSCLSERTKTYFLNESSMKLKINKKFLSNCITKTNIKIEKIFIDA